MAVVRAKPHSKLYDNWDTDVAGVKAMVLVGRCPQTFFHLLHTNAKNIYSLSSMNSAMCEMMSTFAMKGLFLVQPSLREINLKVIWSCQAGGEARMENDTLAALQILRTPNRGDEDVGLFVVLAA